MAAKIHRLVRKDREELSWALQLLLTSANLSQAARQVLLEILQKLEPDPWVYFMSNPISFREITRRIARGPRAGTTIAVWNIVLTYAEFSGACSINASREQIAEDAGTTVNEVSRAMNRLAEIGALVRIKPGQFAMNPHINWIGSLEDRKRAALGVVEPA